MVSNVGRRRPRSNAFPVCWRAARRVRLLSNLLIDRLERMYDLALDRTRLSSQLLVDRSQLLGR
jgi:hypothetical protein